MFLGQPAACSQMERAGVLPACPLMSPHLLQGLQVTDHGPTVVLIPKDMGAASGLWHQPFLKQWQFLSLSAYTGPLLCWNTLACCIILPTPVGVTTPARQSCRGHLAPSLYLQSAQQVRKRLRITRILQLPFLELPLFPLKHQSPAATFICR